MNEDDDFGDLYAADVGGGTEGGTGTLYEVTKVVSQEQRQFEDGDEEELLYGTSSSSAVAAPPSAAAAAAAAAAVTVAATSGFEVGGKDVENEETFLYGELYGSAVKSDDAPKQSEERKGAVVANGNYSAQQQVVAPGLAPSSSFSLRGKEEVTAGVAAEGAAAAPTEEDWDSDSDDGLQIVLNDDAPAYDNPEDEAKGEFYEGSDDEDEEELIIMAGDETLDGQEDWGEEGGLLLDPPLPGPPSGGPPGAAERTVPGAGGDDRGPPIKPGGPGSGPRIGYSGQGYYNAQPHHAQYKYVRPGSGASTGPGAGQAGELQLGGRGAGGGPNWGAGRGGDGGRGDWGGRGRGSSNSQRGQQGGAGPWGSSGGRGYSSGLEFNLPPTKTVFDIDLDALEEKSWQRPGADITDFFNFGFTENSWKQYCQQLAQLRLEATMQSKIRVYESGRSEQEYDPDLPPELMAAQGLQDAPGEYGNIHQRQSDHGAQSGGGRGRGAGRGRPVMPTGRAIQVEGGGGERRPSADIRRQRTRDSDAVIQIVLQDASEDEPEAAVAIDYDKDYTEDEAKGGKSIDHYGNYHHEEEMRDFGPGGPGPWMMDYNPYYEWEGNMGVEGHGPFPMGPGMGVEGHGPFPMGPGMPMRPPGAGPDFAMFPGGPFGMPPYDRGGVGRPPMYGGPRVGPGPMAGPGPDGFPPDHFGMQPPPVGFTDNLRRRTPPRLAHPDRAGPHSGEWEDELSNGSGPNRSGHGAQGNRDRESLSREYDADTKVAGRRSRSELAEKIPDEPALEQASRGHKRSKSKEEYTEGAESELGDKLRPGKRTKAVASNIRRSDAKSSGSSSSDENTESSLDNFKEPAPPRVRETDQYQKVPRHNESSEHHHHRSDSGSRRRPADTREREDPHRRDRDRGSHGHRGVDDAVYDRKSREDRERRDYDEARRRDRVDERNDDARKRGRPDGRDHRDGYHREREEPSRKRELEESGHWPRPDSQKSRVDERSWHADRREKDTRPYDRDRDRARSRGREDTRSHQRDGNRSREDVSRIEHDEERSRENHRRDDRLDERRDDTRSRGGDRVEENRERELRSRRHIEDRPRESEDRRKGEDRSTRSESHRKVLVNGRETGDDARLQIRSRREGSEEREADVARNGSSLAKERSRDHAYDERRRERERDSGRLSSHHDEENRRDHKDSHHQDKDHASERGDVRNSLRSKRPQTASRRVAETEDPSGAHPTKAEAKQSAVEADVSSGDEDGYERRGRSKIERWNSRKEREIVAPTSAAEEKRHRRPHAREVDVPSDAPNDQNASEKRQDHQGRHENHNHQEADQSLRSDSRDRQQSSSGAKRYPAEKDNEGEEDAVKAKEPRSSVVATKSSRHRDRESLRQSAGGEQQQQQVPDAEVTAKLERRKERFGSKVRNLKKPSEEEMASRDEADPVQADPVEVKQERPARKRRWAASG